MNQDSRIDNMVKQALIADVWNLLGIQPYKRNKNSKQGHSNIIHNAERRKFTSYEDIKRLDKDNWREILNADDYVVLFEAEEENLRRGNFVRAFPNTRAIPHMAHLFDIEKSSNLLLWKYLMMKEQGYDILEELQKDLMKMQGS